MNLEKVYQELFFELGKNLRRYLNDTDSESVMEALSYLHDISTVSSSAIETASKLRPEETKQFYGSKSSVPIMHSNVTSLRTSNEHFIKEIGLGKDLPTKTKGNKDGETSQLVIISLYALLDAYRCGREAEGMPAFQIRFTEEVDSMLRKLTSGLKELTKGSSNNWAKCMRDIILDYPEILMDGLKVSQQTLEETKERAFKKAGYNLDYRKLKQTQAAEDRILESKPPKRKYYKGKEIIPYEETRKPIAEYDHDQTNYESKTKEIEAKAVTDSDLRKALLDYIKERFKTILLR
jgi:hypothetical protein